MTMTYTLNDGRHIPKIGFGTYRVGRAETATAITAGYRLLDTALNYRNEAEVGQAVRESEVPRRELFVTTKLPGRHHGYDETTASLSESLGNLGLDHVDLYLIHWPLPRQDRYLDSWRAMIELREDGLATSIGVSNFTKAQLERLADETGVMPAVNQVELHPYFPQEELRTFHAEHGIRTQSWSPLGRGSDLLESEVVAQVADAHGVTPAQAVLRWHVELGSIPIPRSKDATRQAQNLDVFGFELTDVEVAALSGLARGRLWGGDPDSHEEF
ncbi:aldo/keto reductase [Diaminobutyricimonas sp. TR449]|uniref:aldo/keto reductase n=1 Tax=Diaminobutyricimonas sp. TR449 TaxID=2708076 RepID=UPI001422843F|nr:aldo/keto reductase [Diaminobutyricimonas sp. TR449]